MYRGGRGDFCGIYQAEGVGVAEVAVDGVEVGWGPGDLKGGWLREVRGGNVEGAM